MKEDGFVRSRYKIDDETAETWNAVNEAEQSPHKLNAFLACLPLRLVSVFCGEFLFMLQTEFSACTFLHF